ncbi:MAG: cbb3-type cytochrome oxidase assembly protein CcoS [Thermodesulfobacteriota bacterium]
MYYPYFITYMGIGILLGLGVFFWAFRNGQFKDQDRARFLPLEEDASVRPGTPSRMGPVEIMGLAGMALAGLAITAGILIFSIF